MQVVIVTLLILLIGVLSFLEIFLSVKKEVPIKYPLFVLSLIGLLLSTLGIVSWFHIEIKVLLILSGIIVSIFTFMFVLHISKLRER